MNVPPSFLTTASTQGRGENAAEATCRALHPWKSPQKAGYAKYMIAWWGGMYCTSTSTFDSIYRWYTERTPWDWARTPPDERDLHERMLGDGRKEEIGGGRVWEYI
jgi:hypothetical protein